MQNCYGGDPEQWLHMNPALLRAYADMRPRVEADRLLGTYQATAAGTGAMKKEAAADWLKRMQRDASGNRRPPARKATKADLAAMGIGVANG